MADENTPATDAETWIRRTRVIMQGKREEIARARMVVWVDETRVTPAGVRPAFSVENQPGYYNATFTWPVDLATAKQWCDKINEGLGMDREEALNVLISSHAASNAMDRGDRELS